jgi:uncharacterized membrane protein (DUF2068 family)
MKITEQHQGEDQAYQKNSGKRGSGSFRHKDGLDKQRSNVSQDHVYYSIAMASSDSRSRRLLRIIAFYKFIKAALLIATGIGALHLVNRDIFEEATDLVARFHLNPGNYFVAHALERTTSITPTRLHELGIIAFVYSALFLAEGIGLWSLKRWGEWMAVVITSSLLPFEIYEVWHKFGLLKLVVLVFNVLVVWYLIIRLKREKPG